MQHFSNLIFSTGISPQASHPARAEFTIILPPPSGLSPPKRFAYLQERAKLRQQIPTLFIKRVGSLQPNAAQIHVDGFHADS